MQAPAAFVLAASLVAATPACARFGPVYPPRPVPSEGAPLADPEPTAVVAHLALASAALRSALEEAAPTTGEGTFALLGADRRYTWERGPFELAFSQGRIVLDTKIKAQVALPLTRLDAPLELRIEAEPIVSAEYAVRLQSVEVHVTSTDTRVAIADRLAGVYAKIESAVGDQIRGFSYDLRPLLSEAFSRVSKPIELSVGGARACVRLKILDIEAAPTVLADGIEKDIAFVVAPSIAMPCVDADEPAAVLPTLSNVAALKAGPFTVTIPIAARYDELTRAMSVAFTDGKLFFSSEYPSVYLETPEVYESAGQLVLKLHIAGPVHKFGIDTVLDGDLYLTGHPAVIDNELRVPDLVPTVETRSFLLSLNALLYADRIRDEAQAALRLDIGARLHGAEDKLGRGLTFRGEKACFQGDVDRVEVTGVYPHAAYLRVYVTVTARARLSAPCPAP
jgi:hypothetical protein